VRRQLSDAVHSRSTDTDDVNFFTVHAGKIVTHELHEWPAFIQITAWLVRKISGQR
jgi:hypothetical protein